MWKKKKAEQTKQEQCFAMEESTDDHDGFRFAVVQYSILCNEI